jgi:hypothetical protein
MACLLPRVAAASLPVVVLITTASTSPAAAQTFPASERPTRSGYVNPPSSATSPSSAPTSSATQPASPATPTPFFSRTRAHISLRRKQLQPTPGTSASASSSSTTRSAWSSARPGPTTTFPRTNPPSRSRSWRCSTRLSARVLCSSPARANPSSTSCCLLLY